MYIRYIHKLYDLHLKAQNYTGMLKGMILPYSLCERWCGMCEEINYCGLTACGNLSYMCMLATAENPFIPTAV